MLPMTPCVLDTAAMRTCPGEKKVMHDITPHAAVAVVISLARYFRDVRMAVQHAAGKVCLGLRLRDLG
jgi:hypothetical protein